ncbi:phospholipase/Carboxylesterase [Xylaria bambusicola]|uniref:phospholipase/Carboxylesterase n=1 Tax=Xylaria bambusicola TaxID=326684 RepID=UPI002007DFAB|nr:phospholipase/Carboxylesterase [Xylaria bambusicola]KAI0509612.1 phospholipase/Carboxylesterase [Xylaria bambusicola]
MERPISIAAKATHTATVIFLHGLGDSGRGWIPAVADWVRGKKLDHVKWVLPHAPHVPITAFQGMPVPGWFDIHALNGGIEGFRARQDEPGLLRTRDYVNSLIKAEVDAGIPANRIILGGFSQGGAIALLAGLTAKVKLGGVLGLSTWLPIDSKFSSLVQESDLNHETLVYMAHGMEDRVVPTVLGQMSYELLKKQNFTVTMSLFPFMEHSTCPDEFVEVENFLQSCLPVQEEKKSEL